MRAVNWEAAATFLASRAGKPAATWLATALGQIAAEQPAAITFTLAWSAAGRRLGHAKLTATADEERTLPLSPTGFCMDEYGRALLLLAVLAGHPPSMHAALVDDLYAKGELREQQAVLRVLPYLPSPERFVAVAIEAVRSNALTVIEAIAYDNPYPARHFPDPAFNQLVLKCLFYGLSLRRLQGLAQRIEPELKRMVAGYVSERRAAGRSVPEDTNLILQGDPHAAV
jgi:hypothetical protein